MHTRGACAAWHTRVCLGPCTANRKTFAAIVALRAYALRTYICMLACEKAYALRDALQVTRPRTA